MTVAAPLVDVQGTLGTGAPLGSLTSPVISPRVWAGDIPAAVRRRQPSIKTRTPVMGFIACISIQPPRVTSALSVNRQNVTEGQHITVAATNRLSRDTGCIF